MEMHGEAERINVQLRAQELSNLFDKIFDDKYPALQRVIMIIVALKLRRKIVQVRQGLRGDTLDTLAKVQCDYATPSMAICMV